jgi:hypothetical protein
MLDEHTWVNLPPEQKSELLDGWLSEYRKLSCGTHELSSERDLKKIKLLKAELKSKIYKVIELEHIK